MYMYVNRKCDIGINKPCWEINEVLLLQDGNKIPFNYLKFNNTSEVMK